MHIQLFTIIHLKAKDHHLPYRTTVLGCVHTDMSTSPALSRYLLCTSMAWLVEASLVQVEC